LKQNQDSYVLKNLEKKQTNKLRVQREKKTNKQTNKKNTKLLPSDCKPRDQNDISSQNASKREQKKQILYKETNLTIAKKKKNYENQRTFLLQ